MSLLYYIYSFLFKFMKKKKNIKIKCYGKRILIYFHPIITRHYSIAHPYRTYGHRGIFS